MNIAELQKELFSGDTVKVANAHARLVGIEVGKIAKVVNDTLHKKMIDSITFGAFLEVLKEYESIEIDRKILFDILRKLNILDANNNPTKCSEDYCIFVDFLDYFETPFGGVETKERRITPFGQIYLTNEIIDYLKELEEKEAELFKFCDKQVYRCNKNDCPFWEVATLSHSDNTCKITERKMQDCEPTYDLTYDEINEYYKVLEDYKKQEEKEVSVDDMKASLTNYCDGVKLEDCSFGGKCIFRKHFRQGRCKCSSLKRLNTLSDEEVKERYNILMESKGER